MLARLSTLIFAFSMASLLRLGGFGLILLGLADNSVVPLPGSMDVLTIWLAASHRSRWFFYAIMATAGAVLGGYITYALAKKGGKETLERKLPQKRYKKILKKLESKGFATVTISAMLPPPFPIVPVLLAAGALQYPRKKFLAALALGRGARFLVVAGMGAIYGDAIVSFFSKYYQAGAAHLDRFRCDRRNLRDLSVRAISKRSGRRRQRSRVFTRPHDRG